MDPCLDMEDSEDTPPPPDTSVVGGGNRQVKERISACLTDISEWMATHHLKLNLDKTELLFVPYKTSPLQDLSITVDVGTVVAASRSARNLGVVLDDRLDFKDQGDGTVLQVPPVQHQDDSTVSDHLLHPASCPDHGHLTPGLLQLPARKPTGLRHSASSTDPECSCPACVQPPEIFPCNPPAE
ncbi:hypothetical protein SKAU_G00060220 [Synaphobranchus kaupii]|uniref:Uncharacterized protein n=1 Tax=Synaphobranchus kaupii TaxID=118154 RepID=A0A9Q1G4R2_SYNKA|nr:hypothetical protein SKAU_G00060220 [Synaphobranchus kaupii]